MGFIDQSYKKHAEHFGNELVDKERIKISRSWFDDTTADYWRHARMYECADCLRDFPDRRWLTVGDGRWGLDSIRLRQKGFKDVLPTDISEYLLKASKARGNIPEYSVENSEKLSFADNSFDYVLCKESFHHFPRPYLALYEMLRVARHAVFLIEPNDPNPDVQTVRIYLDELENKGRPRFPVNRYNNWEVSGNFVYTISRREIEKTALGLNLPQIVFKGLNDHYIQGCEFEPADMEKSEIFRKILKVIKKADKDCACGLKDYSMLMSGIFKRSMENSTRSEFIKHGLGNLLSCRKILTYKTTKFPTFQYL